MHRLRRTIGAVAVAASLLAASACSGDDAGSGDGSGTGGQAGTEADGSTADGAGTDGSATEPAQSTTTAPTTTTTTLPLITKNAVVKVANAAGVPGSATRFTQTLQRIGYTVAEPTDAAGYEERLDVTKVYYKADATKAAKRMAKLMGVKAVPMPTPVPIVLANEALGDATIVVMLGKDLADEAIPGFTDR